MILDVFQWVNRLKNKDFKNQHSKCKFSQKRVPEAMRIKISLFIVISFKNDAKHSSYVRPYYGNDGKSALRPEFVRLSTISIK